MADIFISYDRDDVVDAKGLAEALKRMGWSVWWDDALRAGSPFDRVIDEQLDAASCVLVLWSAASVNSNWVRAEAAAADEQGKLVPVSLDSDVRVPVLFRQLNVIHLTRTDLSEATGGVVGLLADIANLTGRQPDSVHQALVESHRGQRSSGAYLVTAGDWRMTTRLVGMRCTVDLTLRPNGTVSGRSTWFLNRGAELAGQWQFDAADQVLYLETSAPLEPLKAEPVRIIKWNSPDSAECTSQGGRRKGILLERVARLQ